MAARTVAEARVVARRVDFGCPSHPTLTFILTCKKCSRVLWEHIGRIQAREAQRSTE